MMEVKTGMGSLGIGSRSSFSPQESAGIRPEGYTSHGWQSSYRGIRSRVSGEACYIPTNYAPVTAFATAKSGGER